MSGHTPRPWRVDAAPDLPLGVIEDNEDGNGIATIEFPDSPFALANAALIAAAPDLLEALKRVEAIADWEGPADEFFLAEWANARAAIAKAEAAKQVQA